MATAREKALEFLKNQGYSEGQINDATSKVQKQLDSGTKAGDIMNNVKSNTSSYFGGNAMYGSSSSSSGSSSSSSSSSTSGSGLGTKPESTNTNATEDIYGDVSGKSTATGPMDLSTGNEITTGNAVFGENAKKRQAEDSSFLTNRNNDIAYSLAKKGIYDESGVSKFLSNFKDFTSASAEEQANTIRAIKERLSAIQKQEEDKKNLGEISDSLKDINGDGSIDKAGYYKDSDGNYFKIYGYDGLSDEQKNLLDRLPDSKKKEISNLGAQALQEYLKQYDATMRSKEQAEARQQNAQDQYDISRESAVIQAEQNLRRAEQNYDNLKQNWQYLGNLGMPGTSATKIQAIGDALTEAKTTLGEVKRLTQLSLDAQEKQWEGQVLQYNQQIDNLMYDLRWKIGQEAIDALSKYTSAELEGKLDTIDGITAFKKELLDELDSNLSGITSASLTQMQAINQEYQNIADKMLEYSQNANTVNAEMSQVKGYYVDGNGNPILNDMGQPIQVPQSAPMEPVFDKETGRLITFALDENGQIVAQVQQLYDPNTNSTASLTQYGIVSMLEQGYSIGDILKQFPNASLKDVQALAEVVQQTMGKDGRSLTWQGGNYTAVSDKDEINSMYDFVKKYAYKDENGKWQVTKGQHGGQCGHFVNQYLYDMGVIPSPHNFFSDPITDKMKNINSDEAKAGSIVIMNSASKPQYGHVGIVTNVAEDGTMTILQSNKNGEENVFVSHKNVNDSDVLGFFDPTKSIDDYNKGRTAQYGGSTTAQSGSLNDWGYNPIRVGYYDKYLEGKFTTEDTKKYVTPQFEKEVAGYQAYKNAQASDYAISVLTALYNLEDIGTFDYNMASLGIPRTDGYTYRKFLDNLISNQTLQKLISAKSEGATFGALSDSELAILKDASTILDWGLTQSQFNNKVKSMIKDMEQGFIDNGRSDIINTLKSQYKNGAKNTNEITYFTRGEDSLGGNPKQETKDITSYSVFPDKGYGTGTTVGTQVEEGDDWGN